MRADYACYAYIAVSWLPLATMLKMYWNLPRQQGWGGWALVASMAPVWTAGSAVLTLIGMALWVIRKRKLQPMTALSVAVLVAALPFIWFLIRIIRWEFMRGM